MLRDDPGVLVEEDEARGLRPLIYGAHELQHLLLRPLRPLRPLRLLGGLRMSRLFFPRRAEVLLTGQAASGLESKSFVHSSQDHTIPLGFGFWELGSGAPTRVEGGGRGGTSGRSAEG